MKYTQSEKMEIIRLVEQSVLSVRRTLRELDVTPSSFYNWYKRFLEDGYDGLADNNKIPKRFWNAIPEWEKQRVVEEARKYPEKSCREIACHIIDNLGYFISESSVYRILKANNLVSSPVYSIISASDKFKDPTTRVNQLWQTDFTYFRIVHWGWYYLITVLDDYSRYIIAWKLCKTMNTEDVKAVLDDAIQKTGAVGVSVYQRTRLLSDNGPCFISEGLRAYLKDKKMEHTRGKPYHPQTQGKIERYHRSMKNLILLDNYYSPEELINQIEIWVRYYNNFRYHEAIENVTPSDKYFGRDRMILNRRNALKKKTMWLRRKANRA